jgi:hypothetical protein
MILRIEPRVDCSTLILMTSDERPRKTPQKGSDLSLSALGIST